MVERILRVLKPAEYDKMLELAGKAPTWRRLRDEAILRLAFESGLRVGEIAGLKKSKVNYEELTLIIDEQAGERAPKWRHEGVVPISKDTAKVLKELTARQKEDYLILSSQGRGRDRHRKPLSTRQIENIVKKYAVNAGIFGADKVSPHALRRGFATFLSEHLSLTEIQQLLRHRSPVTSQNYIDRITRQERAISQYHKLFDKNGRKN